MAVDFSECVGNELPTLLGSGSEQKQRHAYDYASLSVYLGFNCIGTFLFSKWGQIVAVRQMNASFLRRFAVWAFACKREFQTDPAQAFIDVHDRELDFFDYFFDQAKK